jgi:hypothetical protein
MKVGRAMQKKAWMPLVEVPTPESKATQTPAWSKPQAMATLLGSRLQRHTACTGACTTHGTASGRGTRTYPMRAVKFLHLRLMRGERNVHERGRFGCG